MGKTEVTSHDMAAHEATYAGFVKGAVALCVLCAFIVVALCQFAFGKNVPLNYVIGFGGIIAGLIAVIIDVRASNPKWLVSFGLLIVYGLLVAVNVT